MRNVLRCIVIAALCFSNAANSEDRVCLAKNIYYEARGESYKGMLAVAKVTINRVASPGFPDTVCKVVYQPRQFSWTLRKNNQIRDLHAWEVSLRIADLMLDPESRHLSNFKLLYFHNNTVSPKTRNYVVIGNHLFY